MLGEKVVYQKIYKDIRKNKFCSAHLETSSGQSTESVWTNNQRGQGSGPCLLWGGLDKSCHIVPTALLFRVQIYRKDLNMDIEGPSSPLDDHWAYFLRRRRLSRTRRNSLSIWLSLVCRLDHHRRPGEIPSETYSWNAILPFGQKIRVRSEELSKYFLKIMIFVALCK